MPFILALQAAPNFCDPLRLNREIKEINNEFLIANANTFRITVEGAVRARDLGTLLMRHKPDIVHFGGHGTESSELVFEDDNGDAIPIPLPALRNIFRLLRDNIQCVVLNACYSSEQAEAIAESINCVIGMSNTVSDDSAIKFATGFYRALAFGKSVQQAFELGKIEVALHGHEEDHIPKLHARKNVDANKIFIRDPPPKLYAEFDMDNNGKPVVDEGKYSMRLYVRHAAPGASSVVYQCSDETISRKKQFYEINADDRDFEMEVSFYGDIRIRATVWYKNHGIGIQTWLADALEASYENSPNRHIRAAIRSIRSK